MCVTGDELRNIRLRKLRLSQAKLADRLGTTATTVARWERGERAIAEMAARFIRLLADLETAQHPRASKPKRRS
jgi:DNA-binding transcriptional regulator YiaG